MSSGAIVRRSIYLRMRSVITAVLVVLVLTGAVSAHTLTLNGRVESNNAGLAGYEISLYATDNGGSRPVWHRLGTATSDAAGDFEINAVRMAANFANPATGDAGVIIRSTPNGTETSTFATFNTLANVVASCVLSDADCAKLFETTTPPGGAPPANLLEAVANIAKYPSFVDADGNLAPDPLSTSRGIGKFISRS
jgi:hypothetical protein